MTSGAYLRPDDGVVDAAEMVEIAPHRSVSRAVAVAMGLVAPELRRPGRRAAVEEFRAEAAEPVRAHEVVGEPDLAGRVEPARAPVDQPTRCRRPPETGSAPVPKRTPRPPKVKRSLKEILADCRQ